MTRLRGAAVGVLSTLALLAPTAQAAPLVAPGAPFRVYIEDGKNSHSLYSVCSEGVAGTLTLADAAPAEVLLTAGHCLTDTPDEPPVLPEVFAATRTAGWVQIGSRDRTSDVGNISDSDPVDVMLLKFFDGADWGTVRLNPGVETSRAASSRDEFGRRESAPVALIGIRDYADLGAWQISFDNFGQPICKDGTRTARSCGTQVARTRNGIWSYGMHVAHGDSGGVTFDPTTREALGVSSLGIGPLDRAQPLDVAVEEAYGIPDGQVNAHFRLPESTAPVSDDLLTIAEDNAAQREEFLAAGGTLVDPPNPRADLDAEVAAAQADLAASAAAVQSAAGPDAASAALAQGAATLNAHATAAADYASQAIMSDIGSLISGE